MEVIIDKEAFKIKQVQGDVHFDRPFRIQVDLRLPKTVDAHSWINQPARFQDYKGIITSVVTGGIHADGCLTEVVIEPRWVVLQDKHGPKLWPSGTAFECVKRVLQEHGYQAHQVRYQGKQTFDSPYWLQFAGETDFAFVNRVLKQGRLHYRFDTDANYQEQIIFTDSYINNELQAEFKIDQHVRAVMTDRSARVYWKDTKDRWKLGQKVQWARLAEFTEGEQKGVVTGMTFQVAQPMMYGGESSVLSVELEGETLFPNASRAERKEPMMPYFFLANLKQSHVYPDFIRNRDVAGFPLQHFHAVARFPYYEGAKLLIGLTEDGTLAILGTLPDKQHEPVTTGEYAAWIDKVGQGVECYKEELSLFTIKKSSVLSMLACETQLSTQGRLVSFGAESFTVRSQQIKQQAAEQLTWRVNHQASFKIDQYFSLYAQQLIGIRAKQTCQLRAGQSIKCRANSVLFKSDRSLICQADQFQASANALAIHAGENLALEGNTLILRAGEAQICLHPGGTIDFIGSHLQFGRGPAGGSYSPTYYA